MNGGEEVAGCFVIAGSDRAEVLELEKEGLDQVPVLVTLGVIAARRKPVGLERDDRFNPFFFEQLEHPLLSVISFVGQELCGLQLRYQGVGPLEVVCLTGREEKGGRVAEGVTGRVNLGAQSAAAAPDSLVRFAFIRFFLAPALC